MNVPTDESDRWTSKLMTNIMKEENKKLNVVIRQVKLIENPFGIPTQPVIKSSTCKYYHPTKLMHDALPKINETPTDDIETPTIHQLQYRVSTASCHKKLRGRIRKLERHIIHSQQITDQKGITQCRVQTQNDSGASHSLTNNKNILHDFKPIPPLPINGVNKDDTALYATGIGYLPVQFDEGEMLLVECLYSGAAEGTLISPTAICEQYNSIYEGWTLHGNVEKHTGYLQLINHDGLNHATLTMYEEDRLWYHYLPMEKSELQPRIRRMSSRSEYELWHHRMGHPNPSTLQKMHKYARGIPKLKLPEFYNCQSCSLNKIKKDATLVTRATKQSPEIVPQEKFHVGQHLHMDFGFLRGSSFAAKNDKGRLITTIDGFRSYLIIVDRETRYKRVFLTTTKHPPLQEVESILSKFHHTSKQTNATVRTDQGGELGKSTKFRMLLKKYDYAFEPTGSNSSRQNGIAEKPNQDLKRIVKCLLHASGLHSGYWSYAMHHAVYLANRTFHSSIGMTPFQALHHTQPDLSKLKIFGAKCFFKHTKTNQKDLDIPGEEGIFLGYTATEKNVYVQSTKTNHIHIALHKSFDEAHMTTPSNTIPPLAKALRESGYNNDHTTVYDKPVPYEDMNLKVKLLSDEAITPTRGTPDSAGLDVYSTIDEVIEPKSHIIIPLDIAICPSPGTYAQIATRSSLAVKGLTVIGGVIDRDYTGNIKVIMQNNSTLPYTIEKGQRIAQLVIHKIQQPAIQIVSHLDNTERGALGFGSTDLVTNDKNEIHKEDRKVHISTLELSNDPKFEFSGDPFDNVIEIKVENKGTHPTRGLDVAYDDNFEKLQLIACEKGTPAGKIEKWRSTIKNGYILQVNGIPVTSISQLKQIIRKNEDEYIHLHIACSDKRQYTHKPEYLNCILISLII